MCFWVADEVESDGERVESDEPEREIREKNFIENF
jgi:hypothetical protein